MTKYCILYHDTLFHAYKSVHKKTGCYAYGLYIGDSTEDENEPMLFDSPLEAKLWLISNSSFPSVKKYMFQINETKADKILAKGKYKLSKVTMLNRSLGIKTSGMWCPDTAKYPLLCELVVTEYVV